MRALLLSKMTYRSLSRATRGLPASRALSTAAWKKARDSDVYANMAIREDLRSRAAYKLVDINNKFQFFLRQGARVVDLGASPGGFAKVAAGLVRLDPSADRWDTTLSPVERLIEEPRALRRTAGGQQRRRKFGDVRRMFALLAVLALGLGECADCFVLLFDLIPFRAAYMC